MLLRGKSESQACILNRKTIIQYQSQTDPFPKSYISDSALNVNSISWWLSLKKHINPKFCEHVIHLQSCIASSASVERLFSTFSFVQDKSRNRLGNERSSQLVNCYRMLNSKTCIAAKK